MPALVLTKECRQKTREMCKKHISPVFEVKKKEKIKTFQSGNQQLETPLAQMTKLWYHIPDVGAGFPVGVSVSLAGVALSPPVGLRYLFFYILPHAPPFVNTFCRKHYKSVEAGAQSQRLGYKNTLCAVWPS